MTVLLDTHVLLWVLDDSPRLGDRARALIGAADRCLVSAASLWEVAIKARTGKLEVPADLPELVAASGIETLAMTGAHAWATAAVEGLTHADPFDRLLVAQAVAEGATLVTADAKILAAELGQGVRVQDART